VVELQVSLGVAGGGVTGAEALPVHSAVTGAGQLIDGGVVSTTVMVDEQELVLLLPSVAV